MTVSDPPSKESLLANASYEILGSLREYFEEGVVLSSTQNSGYPMWMDIASEWQWAKLFCLQFTPSQTTAPIRLDNSITSTKYVKYRIRNGRHRELLESFPFSGVTYYAIPAINNPTQLRNVLQKTVFVDVHSIPENTTRLSVPEGSQYIFAPNTRSEFLNVKGPVCYCLDGKHRVLETERVFGWNELLADIVSCSAGMNLKRAGSHSDESTDWYRSLENENRSGIADVTTFLVGGESRVKKELEADSTGRE